MENIQAIQTHYKGYHFRSRLEARWGIFLDSLGENMRDEGYKPYLPQIEWQYEPEGFKLSSGLFYLPDFYLTTFDCWAEVKGSEPTKEERYKCERLGYDTGKPVILLVGTPGDNHPEIFVSNVCDSNGGENWFYFLFGYQEDYTPTIEILDGRDRDYYGPGFQDKCKNIIGRYVPYPSRLEYCSEPCDPTYENTATREARSARFEFGAE